MSTATTEGIPRDRIRPGRNVRTVEDGPALEELRESIREHGLLHAITVRPADDGFEVVAGERRYRASEGVLEELPCRVVEVDDAGAAQIRAIENLQREDLTALEEAEAYRQLREDVGLDPRAIAAKTGLPVARIGNHLRILELPEELQHGISGDFPLQELKWVLKVPEAAEVGRRQVFRFIAGGNSGKWSFFRVAEILDPEECPFPLEAKPHCLECPKMRRYQVPPQRMDRWGWRGETKKGWPEMPVCFDSDCRFKKQENARRRRRGRRPNARTLAKLAREEKEKAVAELGEDRVVNLFEVLKPWRKKHRRSGVGFAGRQLPAWPRDKKAAPKDLAWPLNGMVGAEPDNPEVLEVRKLCADCPHARVTVDAFVNYQDQAKVTVEHACRKPAQRDREMKEIRKAIEEREERERLARQKAFERKTLPTLVRKRGPELVAEALSRHVRKRRFPGPVVGALLGLDEDQTQVDEDLLEQVEKEVARLWKGNPRKLLVLFALPGLGDHVHSRDALVDLATDRFETTGKEVDEYRLERILRLTIAEAKPLIEGATADEVETALARIDRSRGAKSKAALLRKRRKALEKEGPDGVAAQGGER